jgi:hypothetical protein
MVPAGRRRLIRWRHPGVTSRLLVAIAARRRTRPKSRNPAPDRRLHTRLQHPRRAPTVVPRLPGGRDCACPGVCEGEGVVRRRQARAPVPSPARAPATCASTAAATATRSRGVAAARGARFEHHGPCEATPSRRSPRSSPSAVTTTARVCSAAASKTWLTDQPSHGAMAPAVAYDGKRDPRSIPARVDRGSPTRRANAPDRATPRDGVGGFPHRGRWQGRWTAGRESRGSRYPVALRAMHRVTIV